MGLYGRELRAARFPRMDGRVYLDTATQGVPPDEAAGDLAGELAARAEARSDHAAWDAAAETARGLLAELTGRPRADVALVSSQLAAATMVALQVPDATVVVPEAEFRSNLLPWTTSRPSGGLRVVPHPATTDALCAAVGEGAGLVAVSSVQSADGFRIDLPRLVSYAHRRGALVYVDASQSLGVDAALPGSGADFVCAVGYKWLLGSRGASFLLVAPEQQARFAPLPAGLEGARDGSAYGLDYRPYDDARRFDQPAAWFSWVAAVGGLRLLGGYDAAELDAHACGLAERFRSGAIELGHDAGPREVASPIVSLRHPDPTAAVRDLAAAGVVAAARRGGLRFAFHLYNDVTDVDRALKALAGVRP